MLMLMVLQFPTDCSSSSFVDVYLLGRYKILIEGNRKGEERKGKVKERKGEERRGEERRGKKIDLGAETGIIE